MPPYSMVVSSTARSIDRNEAFRTSSRRLTTLLTSARMSARTTHAATRSSPPRRPITTTQFADAVSGTEYACVIAAVSARAGSISTTSTRALPGHASRAAVTTGASRSGRSTAACRVNDPISDSDMGSSAA